MENEALGYHIWDTFHIEHRNFPLPRWEITQLRKQFYMQYTLSFGYYRSAYTGEASGATPVSSS